MRVRLRPGLRVLWRDSQTIQIGYGAEPEFVLRNPQHTDLELLRKLRFQGVRPQPENSVLKRLQRANLLLTQSQARGGAIPHSVRALLAPQARVWAAQDPDGEGWPVLMKRTQTHVGIAGLSGIGARVARLLAHAGIGKISISDSAPVTPQDVGPGAYQSENVSQRRDLALTQMLKRQYPHLTVSTGPSRGAGIQVLIADHVIEPRTYEDLLRQDTPHLPLVISDLRVQIGPLVIPGQTPCLRCLDLHHTDSDSAWPLLANQLLSLDPIEQLPPEPLLATLAATLTATQICTFIAQNTAPTVGNAIEFGIPDYLPGLRSWELHPECGCVMPSLAPEASTQI